MTTTQVRITFATTEWRRGSVEVDDDELLQKLRSDPEEAVRWAEEMQELGYISYPDLTNDPYGKWFLEPEERVVYIDEVLTDGVFIEPLYEEQQ